MQNALIFERNYYGKSEAKRQARKLGEFPTRLLIVDFLCVARQ